MEPELVRFLAPLLPYLAGKAGQTADKAVDSVGSATWERARALWEKLRPGVEAKEAAMEAAQAVADDADDPIARAAFEFQLRRVLKADPDLGATVSAMLSEARQAGTIATTGARIVHADRGGVAAGGDVNAGDGGIHTGHLRR